jgi:glycolate oxidase FAD binding subunit
MAFGPLGRKIIRMQRIEQMKSVESAASATSVSGFVREAVREAYVSRRRLRISGAGTWLDAGRPVHADQTLSVADDRGIVEYVPGDLTLTARAGTRLSEIAQATREHGQWLPLDPWGGDEGTIGAVVSTATAGPYAQALGLPRDVVLGLEFVTGTGDTVRSGGRVVKNVAGFDLTRLLVGSWGSLGVITEATVRLRTRPEVTRTLAIATTPGTLDKLAPRLRALPFTPLAAELLNGAFAELVGLGQGTALLMRLAGNERSVHAQQNLLDGFGEVRETEDVVWDRLRLAIDGVATWRWSRLPSRFEQTWDAAEHVARRFDRMLIHGNPARGVVHCVLPHATPAQRSELADATAFNGTVVREVLPVEAWRAIDHHPAGDAISLGIRAKFDPGGILNAGILGGGA